MLFVHSLYSPFCKSHVLTHPNCCLIHCTMRLEFVPLITSSESRRKKPVAKWANKITPSWAVLLVGSPFGEKHLYIYIFFFLCTIYVLFFFDDHYLPDTGGDDCILGFRIPMYVCLCKNVMNFLSFLRPSMFIWPWNSAHAGWIHAILILIYHSQEPQILGFSTEIGETISRLSKWFPEVPRKDGSSRWVQSKSQKNFWFG